MQKNDWDFHLFFPLVRRGTTNKLCRWNHAKLWGSRFMYAASGGHVHIQKRKKFSVNRKFEINVISMPMFATCKVKMEQIILFMRNYKLACFLAVSCEVLWEFEHSVLFVKIVNLYFERQQFFSAAQFYGSSVRIKGEKTLYLSVWENFLFILW